MAWRQWLGVALATLVAAVPGLRAEDTIGARMRRDVTYLASDECEGRGVTTAGIDRAADYIAAEFQKAGLKPGGPAGSWFQPFTIRGSKLEAPPRLVLRGPRGQEIELRPGRHYQPMGLSASGAVNAPLVFAGYGVTVAGKEGYDDFAGLDVEGKVVVFLRDTPRPGNRFAAFADRRRTASLTAKLANAAKHKAAAVLFVNDRDTARPDDQLMDFNYNSASFTQTNLPCFHVRRSVVDALLQATAGTTLLALEQDIDRDLKPRSRPLTGWSAGLDVKVSRAGVAVKNVVGVLDGAGPLAKEAVVLGAHYDHLGYGGMGSLSPGKRQAIHHGADDNASGTTVLLEVARRFGGQKGRAGRRLVFLAFSAEESGLLGSRHYCEKQPLFPLEDTVAMLNLDMVGRLRPDKETGQDRLMVYGTKTAAPFEGLMAAANKKYDFKLAMTGGTQMMGGSSDHESFYRKKVPVLFFFTGNHEQYHRPTDTANLINVTGMRKVADLVSDLTAEIARTPDRPQYVKVSGPPVTRTRDGMPRMGVMPGYGDDGEGMLLDGVSEGGPAAKAGLKTGDRIVELAGQPVKGVEGYMALMGNAKRGQAVEVKILRAGKKLTIKVTPE